MPAGTFAPSKLHIDYGEWTKPAIGSTDTGKAWVWNNATAKYEPTTFEAVGAAAAAVSAHVGDADPHAGYLLATGARAGATSQAQEFANGIKTNTGLVELSSNSGGTPSHSYGRLRLANAESPSLFAEIYIDEDASNTDSRAIYIMPAFNSQRLFFGKSGLGYFSLNFANVSTWESVPPFTMSVTNSIQLGGSSAGIRGNDNSIEILSASPSAHSITFYSNNTYSSLPGTKYPLMSLIDNVPGGELTMYSVDSGTSTVNNLITANGNTSGVAGAGYGVAYRARLKSSTTTNQDAGRLVFKWDVATHATRASRGQLTSYYTSTERPAITWGTNSTVALLSFYDVTTPIARQVLATGAGATVDDVITALQALGLVRQS